MGIPPILSSKVCIVGGAIGRDEAFKYINTDWNIWCVAKIYDKVPYATLVFDVHQNKQNRTDTTMQAYQDEKLITTDSIEFPNAYILPCEELLDLVGPVFTSSFSWMVAFAIHNNATEIALCGVNMIHETELTDQRGGLFYILGFARAKGIRILVPKMSSLRNNDVRFELTS